MEDSRCRNIQGNGLGLTIARNLALELGGEIILESPLCKDHFHGQTKKIMLLNATKEICKIYSRVLKIIAAIMVCRKEAMKMPYILQTTHLTLPKELIPTRRYSLHSVVGLYQYKVMLVVLDKLNNAQVTFYNLKGRHHFRLSPLNYLPTKADVRMLVKNYFLTTLIRSRIWLPLTISSTIAIA